MKNVHLRLLATLLGLTTLMIFLMKLYGRRHIVSFHDQHPRATSSVSGDSNINLDAIKESIITSLKANEYKTEGYIVYDCSEEGRCGGWSDRLSGILMTMMISLVTNRKFRINFKTPCDLDTYLTENQIKWRLTSEEIAGKDSSLSIFMNGRSKSSFDLRDIEKNFASAVSYVRFNWDITDIFRRTPTVRDRIPWICDLHYADMYKIMIDSLFKPTQSFSIIASKSIKDKSKKLVCAHVRVGKNPYDKENKWPDARTFFSINNTDILFKFLNKYDKRYYNFFIATDAQMLIDIAKRKFTANFIDIPGNIMHTDRNRHSGACEGFGKTLSDFWLLTECDELIVTRSGYGLTASYVRDNNKALYCMNNETISLCTRYDVEERYPTVIHALGVPLTTKPHKETGNYCYPNTVWSS